MKKKILFRTLIFIFLGLTKFSTLNGQCTLIKITEKEVAIKSNGEQIVNDSTVFFFDENGMLLSSENWGKLFNNQILKIEYQTENGQIIQEKLITDAVDFAKDYFSDFMPNPKCKERLVVNDTGILLLKEDMSKDFYGMKNWEGKEVENNDIYAKYQIGMTGNPILFYTYKSIDGPIELNQIKIVTLNDKGDATKIERIQVAGYGYNDWNYEYKYDECGKWIEKYEVGDNGEKHLKSIRKIEYK